MTEVSEKWEPPSIMDVDNEGFVMARELLYARALSASQSIFRDMFSSSVLSIFCWMSK